MDQTLDAFLKDSLIATQMKIERLKNTLDWNDETEIRIAFCEGKRDAISEILEKLSCQEMF